MPASGMLPRFLHPPGPGYPGDHLQALSVFWLMVALVGCCLFGMTITPFVSARPVLGELLYAGLLLACLVSLGLVHTGRASFAGPIWSLVNFGILSAAVFLNGGLYSPALLAYPVTVAVTGMLWNRRASFGLAVVALVFTGLLALAPPPGLRPAPMDLWATLVVVVVAAGTLSATGLYVVRRAIARSRASEHRLEAILDQSGDGILLVDAAGLVERRNAAAERLLPDVAVGDSLLLRSDLDAVPAVLSGLLAEERSRTVEPIVIERGASVVEVVMGTRGAGSGVTISARDISGRRHSERELARLHEQLVQAQKMEIVGQLASSVAHDFNNYLAVISGCARLAQEEEPSEEVGYELGQIADAADRASNLALRMLDFSRSDETTQIVQVDEMVGRLVPLLGRLVARDHGLITVLAPGRVLIVRSQLEVAVVNLVANARDASPPGHKVVVEVDVRTVTDEEGLTTRPAVHGGDYVSISVRDEGAGIPADRFDDLFQPFFTTKPRGQGTGLGLPTVLRIVHEAGGAVRLTSEVGAGTEVEMLLPVAEG